MSVKFKLQKKQKSRIFSSKKTYDSSPEAMNEGGQEDSSTFEVIKAKKSKSADKRR